MKTDQNCQNKAGWGRGTRCKRRVKKQEEATVNRVLGVNQTRKDLKIEQNLKGTLLEVKQGRATEAFVRKRCGSMEVNLSSGREKARTVDLQGSGGFLRV